MIEPVTENDVAEFFEKVAQAPKSALLLDYDGTLAPFRVERDKAAPYPGVTAVLQEIISTTRTQMFIVTGRKTDDIVSLLGVYPYPVIWGLHGTQRRNPNGKVEMTCVDEDLVQALMEADRRLEAQGLRQTAEYKPGSIAVHWRGRSESEAAAIRKLVLQGWSQIAHYRKVELLEFDGGVELRPPEPDKGDAVREILKQLPATTPVAYLGDDTTDEHAFGALEGRGLRVLVRPEWRETEADIWIKPPGELLEFLNKWRQSNPHTRRANSVV
ncbi:MAG TPA: trehalose-phosphatase [Terriglobales bacterium]|nr:trehalose-phosphatase [Terriglobales bacterium]